MIEITTIFAVEINLSRIIVYKDLRHIFTYSKNRKFKVQGRETANLKDDSSSSKDTLTVSEIEYLSWVSVAFMASKMSWHMT